MVVKVAWGFTIQVSPISAARSTARSLLAATQIGGRGFCTGRTKVVAPRSVQDGEV